MVVYGLLAGLQINHRLDFHNTWMEGGSRAQEICLAPLSLCNHLNFFHLLYHELIFELFLHLNCCVSVGNDSYKVFSCLSIH